MEISTYNKLFKLSIETKEMVKILSECKPGDILAYSELSDIAAGDVRNGKSGVLASARRIVLRDHKMDFQAVPNVGIQCMTDSERVKKSSRSIDGLRRASKRKASSLLGVDYNALSESEKLKHNTNASVLAFIYNATEKSSVKLIKEKVKICNDVLNFGETLKLLNS